jgi:RsiW-degrading membrane proteinase PrsW (M82 family)
MLLIYSLLPVFIILGYVYFKDSDEPEPLGLLVKCFIGGILIGPLVLLLPDFSIAPSTFQGEFITLFIQGAVLEEFLKFVVLYLLIWRNSNFNQWFDGIVYAVFVSVGFAAIENILYVLEGGIEVGVSRMLLAVPAHAMNAVAMGYFMSKAKYTGRFFYHFPAYLFPVFLHGSYNGLLFLMGTRYQSVGINILFMLIFAGFQIWVWRQSFKKIRTFVENDKYNTENEYAIKEGFIKRK